MRAPLFLILILFAGFPLLSQQQGGPANDDIPAVYQDLFSVEEPLNVTLKFDVEAYKKTRNQEVYQDAELSLEGKDGRISHEVQLRAEESIRRKICDMPPVCIRMGNSGTGSEALQDELLAHMVLPCRNAARYEPYLLREYLAYKLYNIITPISYRVRLIRLSIVNTGKRNEVSEDWAFIRESDEFLSQRLKGDMVTSNALAMGNLNPEALNSLSLFQYMIGNADYTVTGRHNLNILTLNSGNPSGFLPVPYEFDYSGLVNTDYAIPAEALGTTSVRERYYLGPCRPEQVHIATIQELARSRDELTTYIREFEYLDQGDKEDMIGYLDSFFNESGESWFIERRLESTCR